MKANGYLHIEATLFRVAETNKKKSLKMERQRNNSQSKEKEESLEKELNETEASNLSDMEFKIMVI